MSRESDLTSSITHHDVLTLTDDPKTRPSNYHWKYPLSSSDPAVVEKSLAGMRTSLHNAKLWGCDAVLLVPAVVNPQTSYRDAWTRSQKEIRTLIPLAAIAAGTP